MDQRSRVFVSVVEPINGRVAWSIGAADVEKGALTLTG